MGSLSHRSWPEALYHVLAHVRASADQPASVYDPTYVAWAEQHLGPATERPLGEDALVLGQILPDHDRLARVQLLALLHDETAEAAACADRDLADLSDDAVQRPSLLATLAALGPAAEVLRCAALLEAPALGELPLAPLDDALPSALAEVTVASPTLPRHGLVGLRALRLRGRLFDDVIFVGRPDPALALTPEHVAWQAAHEATVGEVAKADHPERRIEAIALAVLAERARRVELDADHARWLAHLAGPPSTDPQVLSAAERATYEACLRSPT